MFAGIDCNRNGISVIHAGLVFRRQWFPCDFTSFPFHLKVIARATISGVTGSNGTFVRKDLTEFLDTIPGLVLFDKVNDVIVSNNFLIVIVDNAFELNQVWVFFSFLFV